MARFSKSVRLPYTTEQCFDLVSDIRRYPDFIKWITAMRVSEEAALGGGASSCLGEAVIGFKGFTERFSTRVTKDPTAGSVIASLVKGPFRRLRAEWKITPQDRGTDVRLDIDYDFKNPFIGMLAAANHDLAVTKILDAFLDEGRRRFAAPPSPLTGA
jgi:coenzyme Q-binding protein COQ10